MSKQMLAALMALGALAAPPPALAEPAPVLLAQATPAPMPTPTPLTPPPLTRRPEELQADPMRAYDIDKDGTLDLAEVKSAAAARFDELNPDQDDTLDEREAAPVLQGEAFRTANASRTGKVTKAEYLAYVERMFLQANPDKDGTLDRAEMASPAGQALLRLLR